MVTMFLFASSEPVPITLDDYLMWTDEVISVSGLPNNDSMKFALASIVLEAKDLLTKKEAIRRLKKGAVNQIAAHVFQTIKSERIAKDQAEQEKEAQSNTVDKREIPLDEGLQRDSVGVVQAP